MNGSPECGRLGAEPQLHAELSGGESRNCSPARCLLAHPFFHVLALPVSGARNHLLWGFRANPPSRGLFQKVQQMSEISVQVTPQHPYKPSPPTCCSHPNIVPLSSHYPQLHPVITHHHHRHHPLRLSWLRHTCQRTITSGFSSAACTYGWQKSHWPLHGKESRSYSWTLPKACTELFSQGVGWTTPTKTASYIASDLCSAWARERCQSRD